MEVIELCNEFKVGCFSECGITVPEHRNYGGPLYKVCTICVDICAY